MSAGKKFAELNEPRCKNWEKCPSRTVSKFKVKNTVNLEKQIFADHHNHNQHDLTMDPKYVEHMKSSTIPIGTEKVMSHDEEMTLRFANGRHLGFAISDFFNLQLNSPLPTKCRRHVL